MAKHLREQHCGVSSTDDVLLQYCEPTPLTDEGYPIYTLKTVGAEASCVFLQGNYCSIYAARPRTCRLYPFSAGPGERGRDFEYCLCFDDNQQYHFNGGKVLVKDWLYRNFPREDKEFLKQQYRAIPEIGVPGHPGNRQADAPHTRGTAPGICVQDLVLSLLQLRPGSAVPAPV